MTATTSPEKREGGPREEAAPIADESKESLSQQTLTSSGKMSLFNDAQDTSPKDGVTVAGLVAMVREPSEAVTAILKKMRALPEGDERDTVKKSLPAVTISGTFAKRANAKLKTHSGMMVVDLDHLDRAALARAKGQLAGDPHVVFFYVSPSGEGIKGGMLLDTIPADDAEHKVAYGAVREYLATVYGLTLDPSTKDVSRLAFLSADPDCHHNPGAVPLDVEQWRELTTGEKETERLQQILSAGAVHSINTELPDLPVILQREDGTILGEAGNIMTVEGLMKCGKSALVSAIIGAAIAPEGHDGDFLGLEVPEREGYVVHFDCEQSQKGHRRLLDVAVKKRAGLAEVPPALKSFSFLRAEVKDRWPACELAVGSLSQAGPIRMVIFDGGADFLLLLNDEGDSRTLVAAMARLADKYNCLLVVVIHDNPGSEIGKSRGHFGSELWRKSQSCLAVEKGADDISSVCGKNGILRDGAWPKKDADFFRYDVNAGMHVAVEDPSGERKTQKEEAKRAELVALARKVFVAPDMSHTELEKQIVKAATVADRTARNRITDMRKMGIILHREDGRYELQK